MIKININVLTCLSWVAGTEKQFLMGGGGWGVAETWRWSFTPRKNTSSPPTNPRVSMPQQWPWCAFQSYKRYCIYSKTWCNKCKQTVKWAFIECSRRESHTGMAENPLRWNIQTDGQTWLSLYIAGRNFLQITHKADNLQDKHIQVSVVFFLPINSKLNRHDVMTWTALSTSSILHSNILKIFRLRKGNM